MTRFGLLSVLLASQLPTPASAQPSIDPDLQSRFSRSANAFTSCLTEAVKFAMTMHASPALFASTFKLMCTTEEDAFRADAIAVAIATGKTEADATEEVGENIAKGRAIYLADHRRFFETGKVTR